MCHNPALAQIGVLDAWYLSGYAKVMLGRPRSSRSRNFVGSPTQTHRISSCHYCPLITTDSAEKGQLPSGFCLTRPQGKEVVLASFETNDCLDVSDVGRWPGLMLDYIWLGFWLETTLIHVQSFVLCAGPCSRVAKGSCFAYATFLGSWLLSDLGFCRW